MQKSISRPLTPQEANAVPPTMNPLEHMLSLKTKCESFAYGSLWQSLGIGPFQEQDDDDNDDRRRSKKTSDKISPHNESHEPLDVNNASSWLVNLRKTFLSSGSGTLGISCYRFCLPSSTNPPPIERRPQEKSTQVEEPLLENRWERHENPCDC